MADVVTYANNGRFCFCQIKFDSGERVLISIAGSPPSMKVMKLGFLGIPTQTVWEHNARTAGGPEAYVRKFVLMFPEAAELKHPLDVLRDHLLRCRSISEATDSLQTAEERGMRLGASDA